MSKTYTITLSAAQVKAMEHIAVDVQDWIENYVFHRSAVAIDEIVNNEIKRRLDAGEPISGTRDDIVMAAPIKTAAELQAEQLAAAGQ